MVRTLSKCNDPKDDAGNSVATSRASHAPKIAGADLVRHGKCVQQLVSYSDRVLLLNLNAKPMVINIIDIYASSAGGDIEEIETFYSKLTAILELTKKHSSVMHMSGNQTKRRPKSSTFGTSAQEAITLP
uniref:Uncharacterized protein n=1 Tax=Glossina austeni TaxID=7395 RepID=A0A1A9UNC6_GLOAU